MKSETEVATIEKQEIQPASVLQTLTQVVTTPGIGIDVVERMVALLERQETRQAQTAYMEAMAACQSEIPQIQKDGRIMAKNKVTNKYEERSRYALHEDIDAAIRPIYSSHGFAVSYDTAPKDNKIEVSMKVSHRGGHSETTTIALPIDSSDFRSSVQSVGSTITYAKRQLLAMKFNIVSRGLDDDGQGDAATITEDDAMDLNALMDEVKQDRAKFFAYYKIDKLSDLPAKELDGAIRDLQRKRR